MQRYIVSTNSLQRASPLRYGPFGNQTSPGLAERAVNVTAIAATSLTHTYLRNP